MALATKHTTYGTSQVYGAERFYLEQTILGQGASAPLIQSPTATPPGGAAEIVSITRSGTGIYVVTLSDSYFARIFACADIDDTAQTGMYATIGNWQNLGTSNPAVFTLTTYNASGAAKTDIPLNVHAYIAIAFKKTYTGSAA